MAAVPYISVQPNYSEVFSDVSSSTIAGEKAWLSYYASNAPSSSVHVKLRLIQTKDDGKDVDTQGGVKVGELETSGGPTHGLQINRVHGSWLDLELTQPAAATAGEHAGRSARTQQSDIKLDSGVQVRFPRKTLTKFLPTVSTSKVNDNYTNYPTIDAFDLSLGTADDELDLFVAGGTEGSLYTGRLAGEFDAAEARASAIETLLTDEERHILTGESPDPEERKWDIEARIRLSINTAKSRLGKKTSLKGHVGDVRFVKFFPSNRVVLSTSSDLTCRIWDPFTGDNPRTLQGHKRAVLTAGIIGRGKNILTAGADGSIRLWDVAAPKQIRLMGSDRYSAVNCLALQQEQQQAEEESSKFVVGLASGSWQLFDVRAATAALTGSKYAFPPGAAPSASDLWTQATTAGVTAIDVKDNTVVTGTSNGIVSVWDLRSVSSSSPPSSSPPRGLLTAWRRNNAELNHLRLTTSHPDALHVLVATQDGLPYRAALDPCFTPLSEGREEDMQIDTEAGACWTGGAPRVVCEYAGWDCDQTSWVGEDRQGRVVVAGAEGAVRRY
ncbi:hypothetical protein EX895_004674 [Sporisorium graminicola]|uniref:Uncharacterized protein n=1 Tax=Sporisorium graminicola TaxID=280036 RepID=A0A4U7KPY5_9BASI|nr:hypothetical protein EX895_004674 [Sporisorium graminicola]TKY86525.1 hypothetical protein EX895_004674 [Sporisorium graminicola]